MRPATTSPTDPERDPRDVALERVRAGSRVDRTAGVPMVLALLDHRGARAVPVGATGAAAAADGARVVAQVERLHRLLVPGRAVPDARTTHLLHAEASLSTFWDVPAGPGGGAAARPAPDAASHAGTAPDALLQREALARGSVLRVLNHHLTPEDSRDRLREELGRLREAFCTVDVAALDTFFDTGSWGTPRPPAVPVFYEGYASSVQVAAEVCDELGITGWFAVCTGFVDCPVEEQEVFARAHWIGLSPAELDGRRLAMTWDELAALSQRHVVFPHTASHAGIADVATDDDLRVEVRDPLRRMRSVGRTAPLHAWFLGTAVGASARHDEALRAAGYRYVVSNTMVQRIA